jgi:hypothetical protein
VAVTEEAAADHQEVPVEGAAAALAALGEALAAEAVGAAAA